MKMLRNKLKSLLIPVIFAHSVPRSECENEGGLLRGIKDVGDAKYYSRSMIINDAAALLKDSGHIYSCALLDANGSVPECKTNIGNIVKEARKFMKSRLVWDREELQGALKATLAQKGEFVCFLGSKNTGKSLMLNNLGSPNDDSVSVVDLREHGSDISKGLLEVLEARRQRLIGKKEIALVSEIGESWINGYTKNKNSMAVSGFISGLTEILNNDKAKKSLRNLIHEVIKLKRDGTLTFIIDEANIAFTIIPGQTAEKIREVRQYLAFFTYLTKQSLQIRHFSGCI